MEMKGEYRIALPQAVVWSALNDPEVLKASIPGCEELVRDGDNRFKGRVAAAVGPVRAKFSGEATLSEIDPPNGYTLTGTGSGGAAGLAKGGAKVMLRSDGAETVLTYEAQAQVAGKLAQIGSRLVDMAAKKMADEFFGNFARNLVPAVAPEPSATEAPAVGAPESIEPEVAPPMAVELAAAASGVPAAADATSGLTGQPPRPISKLRRYWPIWAIVLALIIVLMAFWKGLF
jgi:carbon monoxide dehydrogenase subunit G